ncbi:Nitrile-specifier protein 5 [Thelohanellus kitauei]|uniref:Nitrile-specifier protein 5 n=1 Tax=Thelohanellus kitauei TaxID=669202 RepID=A0A0C2MKG3_THEKT|nr:Nitrile-specifier protein 5 [Thelohanellus kitauei]
MNVLFCEIPNPLLYNVFIPQPRVAHCMDCVDTYIIIYGGVAWGNVVCNEMWIYDIFKCLFVKYPLPSYVKKRCLYSAICTFGSVIYIFGGTSYPLGRDMTNKLLSFDVYQNKWVDMSKNCKLTRNIVPKMYRASISYHGGFVYVISGIDGKQHLRTVYRYCTKSHIWSEIQLQSDISHPLSLTYLTTFKNRLYFINNPDLSPIQFSHVRAYDPSNSTWCIMTSESATNTFPENRVGECMAFYGRYGYLSSGKKPFWVNNGTQVVEDHSKSVYLTDVWRIDLDTLEWKNISNVLSVLI